MFIKKILLPNKKLTTNFGFGCSSLMSIEDYSERESLIKLAIENGVLHFDLARYYGLGKAEAEFTKIIKNISQEITISSKFGIIDNFSISTFKNNQNIIRKFINKYKSLKKIIKFLYSANSLKRNYSIKNCRQSLDKSLFAFNTNHIDLFFIHEPISYMQINNNIFNTLEELKLENKIGAYGFSGKLNVINNITEKFDKVGIEVIQFDEGSSNNSYLRNIEINIGKKIVLKSRFGVVRTHLNKLNNLFSGNKSKCDLWSRKLKLDLKNKDDLCFALIAAFLCKYPDDLLLYSTKKLIRLKKILSQLNDPKYTQEIKKEFIDFYEYNIK